MDLERGIQSADGHLVEHLHRGRDDAACDDGTCRARSVLDVCEDRDEGAHVLREGKQSQPDLRDDPDGPLAADDERDAVISREIGDLAAELNALAGRENELDAEHVIGHGAVAQRVRASGVRGDVAADGRDALARRIRGEEQTDVARRRGDREVRHAGLDHRDPRDRIDRNDPPHACRRYDDRVGAGDRPAGETRARAARDDARALGARRAHDLSDFLGRARENDRGRRAAIEPGVVFPHEEILRTPEDVLVATDLDEAPHQRARRCSVHLRILSRVGAGSGCGVDWVSSCLPRCDLAPRTELELPQDVLDVPLGCALADHKLLGDLLIGEAGRDQ